MICSVSHIALFVPDLQEAEVFYENLFSMELIGREIEKEDGLWYTLPFDKGWDEAKTAGVDVTLKVGEGMFHCYPVMAPLFPEASQALIEICDFIRAHLD